MGIVIVLLLILGMIFIGLRAFGVVHPRWHFGWLGMFLIALSWVLGALAGVEVDFD